MTSKKLKIVNLASVLGLSMSIITPAFINVKAAENIEPQNAEVQTTANKAQKNLDLEVDKFLKEKANSKLSDLELARQFVKESSSIKEGQASTAGIVGAGLKALRILGKVFLMGGKGLSMILRPFSAKLKELGVPSDVAKTLTDIVCMLL